MITTNQIKLEWTSEPGCVELTLHEYLEVLQCRPGVLHPDVPEGDGLPPAALSISSHVEERPTRPLMPLSLGGI